MNERLHKSDEDIRELNATLQRQNTQLQVSNKELETFSYSVSHDLRAPLRTVDGFSAALLEDYAGVLDSEGQDFRRRIRAASQRMGELIDDLLKLARVTRMEISRETVDLSAIARSVVGDLRAMEPARNVECLIADTAPINADPRLLAVALTNLLNNAWKFTGKRADARIEFGAVRQEEGPVYFVSDNGAGFDMAYATKLFGAFQRLHAATDYPGNGVGLATVQRIVHRHGGKIWAQSAVGAGTTFRFTL